MSKTTIADDFIEAHKECLEVEGSVIVPSGNKVSYFIEQTYEELKQEIIKKQYERIKNAFKVEDGKSKGEIEIIKERFKQVVSGSGTEWREINQLNSSALLAFLCFHSVNNKHEITIKINSEKHKFNDVIFEMKSPLEKGDRRIPPSSNMDVVLLNDEYALFLESKFTEYLIPKTSKVKRCKIDSYYKKYYQPLKNYKARLDQEGRIFRLNEGIWFDLSKYCWESNKPIYLEGLKQMVCHYLGLKNSYVERPKTWEQKIANRKILLGEILFKFDEDKEQFKCYAEAYKALSNVLNKIQENETKKIMVLNELLTYQQDVFSEDNNGDNSSLLSEVTKKFYGFKKSK